MGRRLRSWFMVLLAVVSVTALIAVSGQTVDAWAGEPDPDPIPSVIQDCTVGGDANNEPPSCVVPVAFGDNTVAVGWQWSGTGTPAVVQGFYVYRSEDGTSWTKLNPNNMVKFYDDGLGSGSQRRGMYTFLDRGYCGDGTPNCPLKSSTRYYYAVTSYNAGAESTKSYDKLWPANDGDTPTVNTNHYHRQYTSVVTPRPRPVRGVNLTDNGDGSVTVSWQANPEPNVDAYKVYMHQLSTGVTVNGTLVATVTGTSTTVTGLAYYKDYYIAVVARDNGGTVGTPQDGVPSVVKWIMPKPNDPQYYNGSLSWAPPHGSYDDGTIKCSICHGIHSAPGPNQPYLLKWDTTTSGINVASLCFTCHDGTGSNRMVKTEFDRSWDPAVSETGNPTLQGKSAHPVLQASSDDAVLPSDSGRNYYGLQLKCTNCHSAHLQPYTPSDTMTETPRLLSPRLKEMVGQQPFFRHKGEGVCYTCHGNGTLDPANANGYDVLIGGPRETPFQNSAHFKYIRQGAAVAAPAPTLIRCLYCHKPHGSPNARLKTLERPYVCFQCHGPADGNPVYHVSHSVAGNDSQHEAVSGLTTDGRASTTTVINTPPDIYSLISANPADADTRHDLWPYVDDPARGYEYKYGGRDPYTAMSCTNCHNPHTVWPIGQANASGNYPLLIDPYNPSPTGVWAGATEGGISYPGKDQPTPTPGQYAIVGFCWRCHDNTLPTASDTLPWAPPPSCGQEPSNCGNAVNTRYYRNIQTDFQQNDEMGYQNNKGSPLLIADIDLTQWYSDNAGGQILPCTQCHDPHGSPNPYRLRAFMKLKLTNSGCSNRGLSSPCYEVKGPLFGYRMQPDSTPSGPPVDFDGRFFCGACHAAGSMMYIGRSSGGKNPKDNGMAFPASCPRCHGHGMQGYFNGSGY